MEDHKRLERQVKDEAEKLCLANPHMRRSYALKYCAGILCPGWDWLIAERVDGKDDFFVD